MIKIWTQTYMVYDGICAWRVWPNGDRELRGTFKDVSSVPEQFPIWCEGFESERHEVLQGFRGWTARRRGENVSAKVETLEQAMNIVLSDGGVL